MTEFCLLKILNEALDLRGRLPHSKQDLFHNCKTYIRYYNCILEFEISILMPRMAALRCPDRFLIVIRDIQGINFPYVSDV